MSKLLLEKLELKQLKQSWKLDQDQLCILAEKQEYLSKYESVYLVYGEVAIHFVILL